MTRDDIIRMAREAGFRAGHIELYNSDPMPFVAPCSATDCLPELVRFAAIVAAAEREACEQRDRRQLTADLGGSLEAYRVSPLYALPGAKGEGK